MAFATLELIQLFHAFNIEVSVQITWYSWRVQEQVVQYAI